MQETRKIVDQMGKMVEVKSTISSIVSLVPSQTELLVDLGLRDRLVGVTKFCVHPKGLKQEITQVGGPKSLKMEVIRQLNPDVIIGNKEENLESEITQLAKEFPVWMSDIYTLEDALNMQLQIGEMCGVKNQAIALNQQIQKSFKQFENYNFQLPMSVTYLIWKDPFMAVGKYTFIDEMLTKIGLKNSVKVERYPEIDLSKVESDFVFLSSEPYPFKEKHKQALESAYPNLKFMLVDGEYFSWYGSRLKDAPNYFKEVLSAINVQN